jgi:hypothetical protein
VSAVGGTESVVCCLVRYRIRGRCAGHYILT